MSCPSAGAGGDGRGADLPRRNQTRARGARRQAAAGHAAVDDQFGPRRSCSKDADRPLHLGCNDAFASLVGRAPADVVGCTVHDLFDATTAADLAARDKAVMFSLNKRTAETWATRADGRRCSYETVTSPFWNDNGLPLGLIGIGRNVTQRHRHEEKLTQAREQVESAAHQVGVSGQHEPRNPHPDERHHRHDPWR